MKFGILNTYWQAEWAPDYAGAMQRAKACGYDVLECSLAGADHLGREDWREIGRQARETGIELAMAGSCPPGADLAAEDGSEAKAGLTLMRSILEKAEAAGIHDVCGIFHQTCPPNFSRAADKARCRERSVANMRQVGKMAAECGVSLSLEVLNRYESFLLNTAAEALAYVEEVGCDSVNILMDTYHMNSEEESFAGALLTAGQRLGHLHLGEYNRGLPGRGRLPWPEIGAALRAIGYKGTVSSEPFVRHGTPIALDVHLYRPIVPAQDDRSLNEEAAASLAFLHQVFAGQPA